MTRIDELQTQITQEVEAAQCDEELRQSCLEPLRGLREAIQQQESVSQINQTLQEAERALDAALENIQRFLKSKQRRSGRDTSMSAARRSTEIKPALLAASCYLETQDDIEGFLDNLRRELLEALARGEPRAYRLIRSPFPASRA